MAFRNEAHNLRNWHEAIAPFVHSSIVLDDGSQDGSFEIASKLPHTQAFQLEHIRQTAHESECSNRMQLLLLANYENAHFVLCLDADERPERVFLEAMQHLIEEHGSSVFHLKVRDLWDSPDQYRVDGIWATKQKAVLMPCPSINDLDDYPQVGLHFPWTPSCLQGPNQQQYTDWNLYHLGSLTPALRAARVAKFKAIDPQGVRQKFGYDYLADEKGLRVDKIHPDRDWNKTTCGVPLIAV